MLKRLLWIHAIVCCIVMTTAYAQTVQPWFDSPLDGQVNSIVVSGNKAYLGGTFTKIGYASGTGAFLDTATAKPDRTFPKLDPVQGRVYTSIPDGRGGWYVGGNFSYVGGQLRKYLVHVRPDHSVDSWNPAPNSFVQCLSLAGNRLYVGGNFTTIAGQSRGYGAVFDTATGNLLSWNPQTDNEITAIQQVGSTVFVGGYFSSLGGQFRFLMGSTDTSAGNATNWFPLNGGPSGSASVSQFIYANGYVYACGYFSQINSVARLGLVKMDAAGNVVSGWNPCGTISGGFGIVSSMALAHGKLYVGGSFTAIGGQTVTDLAAIDTATGQASTWNAAPNNTVRTIAMAGSKLFVGGDFTSIGGKNISYLAAVDTSTGTVSTWDSQLNENPYTLSSYGNIIFAGGLFTSTGSVTRNNLAAVDLTSGLITPWNPNASGGVSALTVVADKVIVGGNFTSIGGGSRSYLAAVDTSAGALIPISSWSGATGGAVFTMMQLGNRLYLGGNFGNIEGSVRSYLGAIDKNTGAVLPWHPTLDNGGVYSLASSGSLVFASGFFSTVYGQTRNYAAAFDTTTDSLTAWNPNPSNLCWSLATQGSTVYLGGGFTNVGGVTRKSIAAVDTATGALKSGFDAKFDLQLNVNAILPEGNQLIIGGQFETINTLTREQLAYIDAGTGAVSSWSSFINNNIGSGTVNALAQAQHALLVGGQIIGILGVPEQNFAVLTDSSIVLKPGLNASHKTIDFGKVSLGGFKDTTVTIANNGADVLNITSVVSSGNPFTVRISSKSLTPGQSFIDSIRFTPAAAGLASAAIIVTSNASSSPDTIQVIGTGVGHAGLHLSSVSISFGNVKVGQEKDTTVTITNNGSDTLKITNFTTGSAVFGARPTVRTLVPSQSFADTLSFSPSSIGPAQVSILVVSNAITSPDTIKVNGVGTGKPVLTLSAHSISFGNVNVGQEKDTTLTITNTGGDTLKITNVTTSSLLFDGRPIVRVLNPGQSFADTIGFSPFTTEPVQGLIFIFSNADSSPDTVKVTGKGIPLTGVSSAQSGVPDHFELSQNYPNPFNPSTMIRYALPYRSIVRIRIYNTLGQLVSQLVSGEQAAGFGEAVWNATVPSGMYFYRIEAVSVSNPQIKFVDVKKMLLLK